MFLTQISHVFLSFIIVFLVLCPCFLCFQVTCPFRAFREETSENARKIGFFQENTHMASSSAPATGNALTWRTFTQGPTATFPRSLHFHSPRPRGGWPRPRPSQTISRSEGVEGHARLYRVSGSSINSKFISFSFSSKLRCKLRSRQVTA